MPTMAPSRPTPARAAQARAAQVRAPRTDGPGDDELRGVLEPIVAAAGFELDTLDVRTAGRRHTVRLVVDSDSGVGLDDIARISRTASDELDRNEHLLGGSYTLEVTSPGVDRPLTTSRHWRRAHLRLVGVRPRVGDPFEGRVGAAGEDAVTLLVGGALREVRYADVAHAAVEVEFAPPPEKDLALLDPVHPLRPGSKAAAHEAHDEAAEDPE
jgi:ribosome maturation factor RimP